MGFYIVKGDLLKVDAIVIPAAPHLRLEGNIGTQIKDRCGKKLLLELDQLKNIGITEAVITNAYNLKCKKIIHVANPMWKDGKHNEEDDLRYSYISALDMAVDFGLESIAFPLLSSGAYSFKPRTAIQIAVDAISDYVEDNQLDVCLVISKDSYITTYKDIFSKYKVIEGHTRPDTKQYIENSRRERLRFGWYKDDINEILENGPEVKKFGEKLKYFMTQKGLTATDVYTGVISKAMYNKILNGSVPQKYTVVSLGINMGLDVYEIDELLATLGERLFEEIDRDAIIIKGIYNNSDVDDINNDLIGEGYPPLKTN